MKFLRNMLFFVLLGAVLILGVWFAMENPAAVPLDLLVVQLSARSIALWVLLAFAIGGVVGMCINIALVVRLKAALMLSNRRLEEARQEAEAGAEGDAEGADAPGEKSEARESAAGQGGDSGKAASAGTRDGG